MSILGRQDSIKAQLGVAIIVAVAIISAQAAVTMAVDVTGIFLGYTEISNGDLLALPRMRLDLAFREQLWRLSMRARFTDGQFTSLSFMDNRTLDWLSVQSLVAFAPAQSQFSYFRNLTRFRFDEIGFANQLYLPANADRAYDQITLDGRLADIHCRSVLRFGLFPIDFRSVSLYTNWDWMECQLRLSSLVSISQNSGFERFRLTAIYSEVPYLSFGSTITDFLLAIEYKTDGKTVTPELRTRTGQSLLCITPKLTVVMQDHPFLVLSLIHI